MPQTPGRQWVQVVSVTMPRMSFPLAWTHRFADLGPDFHTELRPTPLPEPHWVGQSRAVARDLELAETWMQGDEALQAFTGNAVLPGMRPLASVYSGHQFGHWAGQLGDGRAILLGELPGPHGPLEVQAQLVGQQARDGVGRSAGRESHHDAQGPLAGLRMGRGDR
eukprot:gene18726-37770_t